MIFINTLLNRPYVFFFLIVFLFISYLSWGLKRTLLWLVVGYVIAWASEFASINTGIPYGWYFYIYDNMPGEMMVQGVPFWDSLSYPFMIFAGYKTAEFICGRDFSNKVAPIFFGALLTMLLDIVIDPLTNMGEKWFLGRIYYYPKEGAYFGVPLSNFIGWFIVPLCVIVIFKVIEHLAFSEIKARPQKTPLQRLITFLPPLFYLSIACFNIIITIAIGEHLLASVSCLWMIPVVWLMIWRTKKESVNVEF